MYFTDAALDKLRISIKENIENGNYYKKEVWVEDFFKDEKYEIDTLIDIDLPNLIVPDENEKIKIGYDFENGKMLYEALKDLGREQLRDARFWIRLEHMEYWYYMQKRWRLEEGKNHESLIKNRYFFSKGSDSSTARNALTRLWYTVHYSYDESAENRYWLTEFLFGDNDLQELILERNFTRNEQFALNLIKIIKGFTEKEFYPDRKQKRGLFAELNRIGGVKILDFLDYNDMKDIVEIYLKSVEKEV